MTFFRVGGVHGHECHRFEYSCRNDKRAIGLGGGQQGAIFEGLSADGCQPFGFDRVIVRKDRRTGHGIAFDILDEAGHRAER